VDSLEPIDVDLPQSPNSYVVPDCPAYMPLLPQFGPMQDPSIGQLEALSVDDTMTGKWGGDGQNCRNWSIFDRIWSIFGRNRIKQF